MVTFLIQRTGLCFLFLNFHCLWGDDSKCARTFTRVEGGVEEFLQESVLCFYLIDPGAQTQVNSLGANSLYTLCYLFAPEFCFLVWFLSKMVILLLFYDMVMVFMSYFFIRFRLPFSSVVHFFVCVYICTMSGWVCTSEPTCVFILDLRKQVY